MAFDRRPAAGDRSCSGPAGHFRRVDRADGGGDQSGHRFRRPPAGRGQDQRRHEIDRGIGRCSLQPAATLGKIEYVDTVYMKDIGKSSNDIIHKLTFENNILFVRYLASSGKASGA
jgi:hypothetical protein